MKHLRCKHASGPVREAFCGAVEAFLAWQHGSEPTVDLRSGWESKVMSLSQACNLLWHCTDVIPGSVYYELRDAGLEIKLHTYAACARALKREINQQLAV